MTTRSFLLFLGLLSVPFTALPAHAQSDDSGDVSVRTGSPRDTLRSFLVSMDRYADGKRSGDLDLQDGIRSAVECLNLRSVPAVNRIDAGRETAILLKEIIDRKYLPDYDRIPGAEQVADGKLKRWKLGDTSVTIELVEDGAQKGQYLFSPTLVDRVASLYKQVKDDPFLPGSGMGAAYDPPWILRFVPDWAQQRQYLGFELWQWIGLVVAIFCGLLVRAVVGGTLHLLQRFASRTKGEWDDLVVGALPGPLGLMLSCGFWLICVKALHFSGQPLAIFLITLKVLLFASFIWLALRFADLVGKYLAFLANKTDSQLDDQIVKLVARTLKLFVVLTGVILAAQNLGFDMISLLAGLSIGGLAVALAMQTTLSNFIGSIIIMIDRSFKVGDWIKIGDAEGEVEEVDFRCTRLRTFYDSVITIPNAEVMTSKIDNLGMRRHRRQLTSIHVTPDTAPEKIDAFVEGIKQIITASPAFARQDRLRVVLKDFGTSSLEIMLYFFLEAPNLSTELVHRHRVFLEVLRLARKLEIRFALPIQAVQVERADLPEN